jgi:hypothetical protein
VTHRREWNVPRTGRFFSNEPAIQNIPLRTEVGREIAKALRPPVLILADYADLEMRYMMIELEGKLVSARRPFWRMLEVVEYDKTTKVFTVPADFCGPEAVTVTLEECFKLIEARYGVKRLQILIEEDAAYRKQNGGA